MKKIVIFLMIGLLFCFFYPFFSPASGAVPQSNNYILNGFVLSHIPGPDLLSRDSSAEIGIVKVDNAYDLKQEEYFCNSNAIPLFAEVNLFYHKFTAKKPLTVFDLQEQYYKLSQYDYYDREKIISTIVSGVYKNNIPLSYHVPSPPAIRITYKEISTGRGNSYIPIRVVTHPDTVDTYFLLNPFSRPQNERLNAFDFAQTYDINPCYFDTVAERKMSHSSSLNFTGFYVDLPSQLVSNSYYPILQNSVEKFSKFVHRKGKLLILENLNSNTYKLGKYADIIGVKSCDISFLENIRKAFPNKPIFATIDANFSTGSIANTLRTLSLFGIYPEFGRDLSSGDFLYYEEKFDENINLINRYLDIIRIENGFKFQSRSISNGFSISSFASKNGKFYVISGNGMFELHVGNVKNVFDIHGKQLKVDNGNITVSVNGINAVYAGNNSVLLLGMVPQVNSKNTVVVLKNLTDKRTVAKIEASSDGKTIFDEESPFVPLAFHLLYLKPLSGTFAVKVNNTLSNFNLPNATKNYSIVWLLLILLLTIAILYALISKKIVIKKLLSIKAFLMSVFFVPALLIILNSYFIHYSLHTVTYFVFALMFLILAFYDSEFYIQSISISLLMLFMGILFNYFEFGTLAPHFFSAILPFQRYEILLFILPFVLTVTFFGMYGGAKINKLEIAVIMLCLSGPVLLFTPAVSPFVLNFTVKSSYMIFLVIAIGAMLGILHKKAFVPYLFLYIVLIVFLFAGFKFNNIFFMNVVSSNHYASAMLFLKDFLPFSFPIFFLLLFHHNVVKTSPRSSINIFVLVIMFILVSLTFVSQWLIRFFGNALVNDVITLPAYIIAIFMFLIVLLEPMNRHEEF